MNDETWAALKALAKALTKDPAAIAALRPYGQLPLHVCDAVNDFEDDEKAFEGETDPVM
jgi:hypothetical protein